MDGLIQEVLVVVVVDVLVAETSRRASSPLVSPVVVMVCNVKVSKVDIPQLVAVANEG